MRYFYRGEEITKGVYWELHKRLGDGDPDLTKEGGAVVDTGIKLGPGTVSFAVKDFHIASGKDFLEFIKKDGIVKEERGVKHDFSKPQMSLLPLKDLEGVVRVLEFGAKKYARGDWAFVPEGGPRYLDAGIRHLEEVVGTGGLGNLKSLDPESGLPHIDHAICSLIFARHFIFKEGPKDGDK